LADEVHASSVHEIVKRPHGYYNSGNPEKQLYSLLTKFQEILEIGIGHENKRPTAPDR
jgi:hypothetical protein